MPEPPLTVSYFGKLPARGDFVRLNAGAPDVVALDEWLQEGLYLGKTRVPGWDLHYDRMPPRCFLFPGASNDFLLGTLGPSRDRSGRRYPFLVFVRADAAPWTDDPALAPIWFSVFLDGALAAVRAASDAGPVEELTRRVGSLPVPDDPGPAQRRYGAYLANTPLEARASPPGAYGAGPEKHRVLAGLAEALRPLQGREASRFALGLRIPLGPDPEQTPCETTFWIQVCARLTGAGIVRPCVFWTPPAATPAPEMHLFFRRPPARSFVDLVTANAESELIYDAAAAYAPASPAPAVFQTLLEPPGATLQEVLRHV